MTNGHQNYQLKATLTFGKRPKKETNLFIFRRSKSFVRTPKNLGGLWGQMVTLGNITLFAFIKNFRNFILLPL